MVKIRNPPLISFILQIHFSKLEKITFNDMAEVESVIKKDYPNVPHLNIMQSQIQAGLNLPMQIGPIVFSSEDKKNELHIFSDAITFKFDNYDRWTNIKEKIREISSIFNILKIENVNHFWMQYIDIFNFPSAEFNLNEYFNLNYNVPDEWELNLKDFHLGINLKSDVKGKSIIRLRGIGPKEEDKYTFRLESFYQRNVDNIELTKGNLDPLIETFDKTHDEVISDFLKILSDKTKEIYGVEEDE